MTLFKALATVVGTAIGFGIVGTGIGALMGTFTPGFFRHLMPLHDLENLNALSALELGIGLGIVNGLLWGLIVGVLVVAIVSGKEILMSRKDRRGGDQA